MRQELVEPPQGCIGMRGPPEYLQQLGYEFSQDFAGSLAASSAQPAVMPAAHQRGHGGWLCKAELPERMQGFAIIVGAREDEIARAGEGWGVLEKLGIVSLDRGEMSA